MVLSVGVGLAACLAVVLVGVSLMSSAPNSTAGHIGEALISAGVIAAVIFGVESFRDSRREKAADRRAFVLYLATTSDLRGVDLSGADLRGLDLRGRDFRNANLNFTRLDEADLSFAQMAGARIRYASLRDARLDGVDLRLSDLRHSDLSQATMTHSDFRGALVGGCRLVRANCSFANFSALTDQEVQDFRQAQGVLPIKWYFTGGVTRFDGVDARNSDLHGANFGGADLNGTDLTFARLSGEHSEIREQAGEHLWWQLRYMISGGFDALTNWYSSARADENRDPRASFAGASLQGVTIERVAAVEVGLSTEQIAECHVISDIGELSRPRRWTAD